MQNEGVNVHTDKVRMNYSVSVKLVREIWKDKELQFPRDIKKPADKKKQSKHPRA